MRMISDVRQDKRIQLETPSVKVGDLLQWDSSYYIGEPPWITGLIVDYNPEGCGIFLIKWASRVKPEPFSSNSIHSLIEQGRMKHFSRQRVSTEIDTTEQK